MTLQPTPSSNGRVSPPMIRSLGCLGSASLIGSHLLLSGISLAQESLDSVAASPESAPIVESVPVALELTPVAIEPTYVEPEPVYVELEPAYVPPAPPAAYVEPAPAYEAPLPAPALESPVVNLSPQDLAPVGSADLNYGEQTQVETVFDEPLEDYVPRLDVAPGSGAGGSFIDSSDLYSTGATQAGEVYAEDAELLADPEVIVNQPLREGSDELGTEAEDAGLEVVAPAQSVAESSDADAPLTVGADAAASTNGPTNVTAAQAAKVQTAAQPGASAPSVSLPQPSTAATTQVAGSASRNNGYSVTYPSASNPLSVAVHSLGQSFAPSLNVGSYFARTQRPNAVPGNGDRQLLFPLSIPAPISSVFGWRTHPIFGNRRFHSGTDLAAEQGTPIVATLSGRTSTADFVGGYGLTVVLDHADGKHQTLYSHMSEIYVQPGQVVRQGEVIGRVGSTGNSTGPHLHFEIRELTNDGWVAIDPGRFLEGSIAQLMQILRSEPMQPISIAQVPIKLSPGQLNAAQQQPIKLATGLQPLLQKQRSQGFQPKTPLEQKVVEVVRALEGTPTPQAQRASSTGVGFESRAPQMSALPISNAPQIQPVVSQARAANQDI